MSLSSSFCDLVVEMNPWLSLLLIISVINRDRKRKRFVKETGKDDQKKKIRTDGGQIINNKKNRKNLYPSNKISLYVLIYCYCHYCSLSL